MFFRYSLSSIQFQSDGVLFFSDLVYFIGNGYWMVYWTPEKILRYKIEMYLPAV